MSNARVLKQVGKAFADSALIEAFEISALQLSIEGRVHYQLNDQKPKQLYDEGKYTVGITSTHDDLVLKNVAVLYDSYAARRDLTEALLNQYRESALVLRTATTLAGTVDKKSIAEKLLSCFSRVESGAVLQEQAIIAELNYKHPSIPATREQVSDLSKPDMGSILYQNEDYSFIYIPLNTTTNSSLFLWRKAPFSSVDLQQANTFSAIAAAALDNAQRFRIQETLSRYMPTTVVKQLTDNTPDMLEGIEQQATILFVDLRGFTKLTEDIGARKVVSILNTWFSTIVEIVKEHYGVVDKFLGDGMLAVYGVPRWQKRYVIEAIETAKAMEKAVQQVANDTGYDLKVGIGIGTGAVISGNIGASDRLDFTVIGSSVNRAAKLQLYSKTTDFNIILDQNSFEELPQSYQDRCKQVDHVTYGYKG